MVMKAELGWIPLYGWFSHKFQHISSAGTAAQRAQAPDPRRPPTRRPWREIVIFPRHPTAAGRAARLQTGFIALYEGLGLPCYPLALTRLFWPRRSIIRYPAPSSSRCSIPSRQACRAEVRALIQDRIETACDRLTPKPAPPQTRRRCLLLVQS